MTRRDNIKRKIFFIIFWVGLISSFIFFAALIHLKANGFKMDYRTWKLVQTGMIILGGNQEKAEVKVDGQLYAYGLPVRIANLAPASYDVTISKDKYQTWQKSIQVESGKASINQSVTLFLENPPEITPPENLTPEVLVKEFQIQSALLKINGSEIYYQDKLVSRFSQDIAAAIIYPDDNHLIFQQADEVRVIELDGSNNHLLFKLRSAQAGQFSVQDNNLFFMDEERVQGRNIR